ncbi:MAG: L-threonylcarbamoyladenylate synthase [Actinomycetota bacterium]|nr:L-threonylcarbamoyladenylate synthase [Actinomycetota bacterium]
MLEIANLGETDRFDLLGRCLKALLGGGLLLLPTDTVYGLAVKVDMRAAVERIFQVKGRKSEKALVVMVSSRAEAEELAVPVRRGDVTRLGELWPGPLTLVVEAVDLAWKRAVAPGSRSLGIRIPDDRFLLDLLRRAGPLAVTSANLAGEEPPNSLAGVDAGLMKAADLVVDGGVYGSGRPSTVAEISGKGLRLLRQGEIGEDTLQDILRS